MNISNYIPNITSYISKEIQENGLWLYGKASRWTQPIMNKVFNNELDINEVCTGVYISDFASACNVEELKKNGITHIVTAIKGVGKMYPDDFEYYEVDIVDRNYSNISDYFDACSDFIDKAVNDEKKVLIHCKCGVSRSTTLIAAYLIKKKNYSTDGALEMIKKCRKCANPNEGFIQQLRDYESDIKKKDVSTQ